MLIKVFNKETASIEKIDHSKVVKGKHVHINTHEELDVSVFGKTKETETK